MQRPLIRRRFERIGLAIGILLAIFIVFGVINWVLKDSDQGPLEPSPVVTQEPTAGPTLPVATPKPTSSFDPAPPPAPGSLIHMLGYAPDRMADNSLPLSDIAQYADIQRWMTARGIETPTGPDDPAWEAWNNELDSLAIPDVLSTRGSEGIWQQTYGFRLLDVHQVLAVGSAPDFVMVLRGDFDAQALSSIWAENGYQAVSVDGITYWSLYPGGSVDLSAPASRPALGNMNNVVILEDGTLIATARSGRLEQTLRAIQGTEPTLADNANLQAILAPGTNPEGVVTAMLMKGSVLAPVSTETGVPIVGTPTASQPVADLLIAGLYFPDGHADRASMFLVTRYESSQDATLAYTNTNRQLATGLSAVTGNAHSDRMQLTGMRILATTEGEGLLIVQVDLIEGPSDWLQVIEERDLGFFTWPATP